MKITLIGESITYYFDMKYNDTIETLTMMVRSSVHSIHDETKNITIYNKHGKIIPPTVSIRGPMVCYLIPLEKA